MTSFAAVPGGVPAGPPDVAPSPAAGRSGLPVEPRDYLAFYRAPRFRWWKPVVAIALAGGLWAIAMVVLATAGLLLDGGFDNVLTPEGGLRVGPWLFLANNVSIAVGIPIAWLAHRVVFGQAPRWLSSVVGGLRWRWLARCLTIVLPLWLALVTVGFLLAPPQDVRWREHTWLMIVGILLTTPLQAAGEEYLVRGFLGRAVASWFRGATVGFLVSTAVTASVFTALHGAGDPWLNVFYFSFGVVASWLTWRTGGLEASIVIHVVNNLLSMVFLPFTDFSDLFDRSAGAGDASVLLNMGVLVVAALVLDRMARGRRLVRVNDPGRRVPQDAWSPPGPALPPAGWQAPPQGWQPPPSGWRPPPGPPPSAW